MSGVVHIANTPLDVLLGTDNAQGDAFGRFRVSSPSTLFDSKQLYGKSQGVFWDEVLIGTASSTHSTANSCVDMTVTANNDAVIRQTRQKWNYQPGKSQLVFMTGILHPQAGTTKAIGIIQGSTTTPHAMTDGICFETIGTTMYVAIYKGGVATRVSQENWNIDSLDGRGPAGVTADWSKAQIFIVDFEWLGVGRVRCAVNIDGKTYAVHAFNNANNVTDVYMRSGNQPVRYEMRSTGNAGTFKHICCSVQSEGGQEPTGLVASLDLDGSFIPGTTAIRLLLAIRLKSTQQDASVKIEKIQMLAKAKANSRWVLCWNPIITGTPNWVDVTGSSVQRWDGTGAETVTPTLQMDSGYFSADSKSADITTDTNLRLGASIAGVPDIVALAYQTMGGTDDYSGGITLREFA